MRDLVDRLDAAFLQRGLLVFFALWYTLVVATNVTDLLRTFGVLPESFGWTSDNFAMMTQGAELSGGALVGVLVPYVGGVCWEAAIAALCWRAVALGTRDASRAALVLAIAFWTVFLLLDEAGLAYRFGRLMDTHFAILGTHLLAWLIVDRTSGPEAA